MDNTRWKWRTANCEECGNEFKSTRSDASFCGATCRKAASRRTENIKRQATAIRQTLHGMKQMAGKSYVRKKLLKDELLLIIAEATRLYELEK